MANSTTNISLPLIGMNQDLHSDNLESKSYPFALNATLEDFNGNGFPKLQNEPSNVLAAMLPRGYAVIGRRAIPEQDRVLYMLVSPLGGSEIGEIIGCKFNDNTQDIPVNYECDGCILPENNIPPPLETITQLPYCSYRTINNSPCLNFNINFPVDIEYRIDDCSLNIYFTDNNNQRRYLYFDYLNDNQRDGLVVQNKFLTILDEPTGCVQPTFGTTIDCNKIAYHPTFPTPCKELVDVISGGSLKAGVYQFLFAYADVNGIPRTQYSAATNPIPIFTKQITLDTNYVTDKAIVLNISDLDQTDLFNFYNIVVAETIDNFTTFKLVGTFLITENQITYTGDDPTLPVLTGNDVFFKRPFFKAAKSVTSANNYLFFSGLKEWSKPNFQRVALDFKIYWETVAIPEAVYNDPKNVNRFRSYMRDEVYPVGAVIELTEGDESCVCHIPAPSKAYFQSQYGINVDQVINNNDVIKDTSCIQLPNNCCDDNPPSGSTQPVTFNATVKLLCSDHNCTEQGAVSLQFNFPTPTAIPLTLYIGQINHISDTTVNEATGFDIFTLPPGVTPMAYYNTNAHLPFVVNIPQGVTSYLAPNPILLLGNPDPFFSTWICHSCLFPTTDLYIKPVSTINSIHATFTNPDGIVVHNIDNDVPFQSGSPKTPPGCVDCSDLGARNKLWQVYNTGQVIGTPHQINKNCEDDRCWEWGDFAYWESSLPYPNDPVVWGDLCGQPIRYAKFPDSCVTHIHDGNNPTGTAKVFSDNNIVFPIGIRIDHDSVITALNNAVMNGIITQDDRNRVKGYRIVRGNRVGHKSIIAKGLMFDMWDYDKFGNKYYYANYPYNDLQNDDFISNDPNTYQGDNTSSPIPNVFRKSSRYTFHSPDTHFVNPTIGTELKLETAEYGQSEGFFNHCEEQAKYKLLSTVSMTLAFAAGIAAALSATTERECTTYTQKADYKQTQVSNGQSPYSNISGTGTSPGGFTITTTEGTGTFSGGERKEEHNNPYGNLPFSPFDPTTGLPTTPVNVDQYTKTTCTGTKYQLLSPLSGSPVGFLLQQAVYQAMLGLQEMQIVIDLINSLIPFKNLAIQYNSVGKYNNFVCVPNNTGNKIRSILRSAYLDPIVQLVNEAVDANASQFTNIYINNWNRESSVYFKTDNTIALPNPDSITPVSVDNSRGTMDNFGLGYGDLGKLVYRNISSYYASIRNYVPDQYGDIFRIEYLDTGACSFDINKTYGECSHVFGGDTFINRFALKIKVPFFLQTMFKEPNQSDVIYSDLGNVGFPNYYFNSPEPLLERIDGDTFGGDLLAIIEALLGVPKSRMDAKTAKAFYQNGYIHLYNYGIPYFLVESDVNVDYRTGQNNLEKDFYPHQQDLNFWLQEKNVPITEDNTFFYNKTYSKQNKESVTCINQPDFVPDLDCETNLTNTIIYSDPNIDNNSKDNDNWLIFKANNTFDFPLKNGKLISADGIENDKILVRFENTALIYAAYNTLDTSADEIQIGTGAIFASRPKEFSSTTLGYGGTQHRDLLQTEYGHIWVDAKRGQIFNLASSGGSLDEISKNGMKNWFKENLPFQILRDFNNFAEDDIDNNFKGIGLHMSFDKRFNRFFITKLDYKVIDKRVQYDDVAKEFFFRDQNQNRIVVSVQDTKYFCNKSWTLSYNFFTKSWVSYHSFLPNVYVDHIDYIDSVSNVFDASGITTVWSHDLTNKSYQVYYGKLQPFIVETISTPGASQSWLNSVSFTLDVLRYQNDFDWFYNREITFNKGIVYNQRQCSGMLEFVVKNPDDLSTVGVYPQVMDDRIQIEITNSDNRWNFNQFSDTVISQQNNIPFFLNNCANSNKSLNLKALDYYKAEFNKAVLRSEYFKVRLINDKYSSYKFIFSWLENNQNKSYR